MSADPSRVAYRADASFASADDAEFRRWRYAGLSMANRQERSAGDATAERERPAREVSRKIRARAFRRRRSKIVRPLAFYGIVTLGMLIVAVLHRDTQAYRSGLEAAEKIAAKLQAELDGTRRPPRQLPELEEYSGLTEVYYFNIFYAESVTTSGESGVCCLRRPSRRLLQSPGRFVVLFNGREFRARWFDEEEFRARATALGLGAVLTP